MATNINRDQLAKALGGDPRLIRQIELLAAQSTSTPTQLQDIALASEAAAARAGAALSGVARVAEELAPLATAPAKPNQTSAVDYLDFRTSQNPAMQPGRAAWNGDDGTLNVGLLGGSVLQLGQEVTFYAKNTSGTAIANGTPCMFTGTVGASGHLEFGPAVSDGSVSAEYMMGVATQDIAHNAWGYITSFGLVRGWNTSGAPYGETWADGDLLYFDPATPGTWTNVRPSAPAIKAPVAVVVNAATGGSGTAFVRMRTDMIMGGLHDVHAPSPASGHILIYDAVQARWESATITAGSNITITNSAGGITIASSTSGVSGTFTSADGKTITVTNGLITAIV